MPEDDAEAAFREGLTCFEQGDHAQAADRFREALTLERERGATRLQMRYLSWFSLATAHAFGVTRVTVEACESAAERVPDAEMQLNLGRIYMLADRRGDAIAAFDRGLRLAPNHPALKWERATADRRVRPVIARLGRNHILNRILGKRRRGQGGGSSED